MRNVLSLILLSLAAPVCLAQTLASTVDTGSAPASVPKKPVSFDLSAIDKTADPCTDFYQYACGNWKKDNPIPADQVRWGRFNELADRNNYLLYKDLKAAADAPKSALQKQYGDYFAACMNTELADKLGAQPLQPDLDAIAAIASVKDLAAYNAKQERRGGGGCAQDRAAAAVR